MARGVPALAHLYGVRRARSVGRRAPRRGARSRQRARVPCASWSLAPRPSCSAASWLRGRRELLGGMLRGRRGCSAACCADAASCSAACSSCAWRTLGRGRTPPRGAFGLVARLPRLGLPRVLRGAAWSRRRPLHGAPRSRSASSACMRRLRVRRPAPRGASRSCSSAAACTLAFGREGDALRRRSARRALALRGELLRVCAVALLQRVGVRAVTLFERAQLLLLLLIEAERLCLGVGGGMRAPWRSRARHPRGAVPPRPPLPAPRRGRPRACAPAAPQLGVRPARSPRAPRLARVRAARFARRARGRARRAPRHRVRVAARWPRRGGDHARRARRSPLLAAPAEAGPAPRRRRPAPRPRSRARPREPASAARASRSAARRCAVRCELLRGGLRVRFELSSRLREAFWACGLARLASSSAWARSVLLEGLRVQPVALEERRGPSMLLRGASACAWASASGARLAARSEQSASAFSRRWAAAAVSSACSPSPSP